MVKAVAVIRGDSKVTGTVFFEQSSESDPTTISWDISGLDANALRGFHVHALGDITNGCTSAGPHFNVEKTSEGQATTHGAPEDSNRHTGDVGNITSDASGVSKGTKQDTLLKLLGPNSIIGRSVVVHEGTDDLGKGGHELSATTGNAGGRAACGVIGVAN
ncbi:superoxide dismutase [Cu-Zn] 1 [[Candida] jaroonii]|uniref:Superoxide dismutase [Cu-Zn] 1 n=1 Tax=[Candida] jaroonii TaxID=467808 RepID=A0ACA9YG94_9ASCO|nr:superoxide dismutase [Cu-Zn] 1 [[Candida] jaroonii]